MSKIATAILCLGLTWFGFEHDSGWAFAGAFFALLATI